MLIAADSFWYLFLFVIDQMAAFPAFIMWTTPLCCVDFLCERKGVGLDYRIKGHGPIWKVAGSVDASRLPVSLIYDQQMEPFHHRLVPPVPAGTCCYLGLDSKKLTQISHNLNESTSSTPPLFQIFIALLQLMKPGHAFITPAKELTFHNSLTGLDNPKPYSAILNVEPPENIFFF